MIVNGQRVQRVNVGDEVSADAVCVYEFEDARLLLDLLARVVATEERRVVVPRPTHGLIRYAQVAKYVNVEVLLAQKQRVDTRQKRSRLRALYDAVIVGR